MILLNGIKWINYQGVLVPDEIPDKIIRPSRDDIHFLLKESGAYFIRWETDFDCGYETEYWHIIKDEASPLEALSGNARSNIRRGLRRCIIKKVDAQVIAKEGYETYIRAFGNYDTFIKPETKEEFISNILKGENKAEWEFWGVWNMENKMIGYTINNIIEDRCFLRTIKFHPEFLKLYPSDALFYTMNMHYLNERGIKYIDDGPRSLSHRTNVQDYFLTKFKFRKAYSKLNIAYSPGVKIIVNLTYPFRKIVSKINISTAEKLSVLLKHEEIRRSFERIT